jgi:hypothetical protein
MANDVIIPEVLNNKNLTKTSRIVKLDIRSYWTPEEIKDHIDHCGSSSDAMLLRFLWMSGGHQIVINNKCGRCGGAL